LPTFILLLLTGLVWLLSNTEAQVRAVIHQSSIFPDQHQRELVDL